MIKGVGVDLVYVPNIARIYAKYKHKFAKKILTLKEQEQFKAQKEEKKINFLAKRFALKEAVAKALGTGFRDTFSFLSIEITQDAKGKPEATLKTQENAHLHISVTDEHEYVSAFAVLG